VIMRHSIRQELTEAFADAATLAEWKKMNRESEPARHRGPQE